MRRHNMIPGFHIVIDTLELSGTDVVKSRTFKKNPKNNNPHPSQEEAKRITNMVNKSCHDNFIRFKVFVCCN